MHENDSHYRRRKIFKIRVSYLTFIFLLSSLAARGQSIEDMDYPDEKLLARIEKDYRNELINERGYSKEEVELYGIEKCYGIYNGCVALTLERSFHVDIEHTEIVAGFEFTYPDSNSMCIWNDGKFYSMQEAYNNGVLKYDDIVEIYEQYVIYADKNIPRNQ